MAFTPPPRPPPLSLFSLSLFLYLLLSISISLLQVDCYVCIVVMATLVPLAVNLALQVPERGNEGERESKRERESQRAREKGSTCLQASRLRARAGRVSTVRERQ